MSSTMMKNINGIQRDLMCTPMTQKTPNKSGTSSTPQCNNLAMPQQVDAEGTPLQRMMSTQSPCQARKSRQGNNCGSKGLLTGLPTTHIGRQGIPNEAYVVAKTRRSQVASWLTRYMTMLDNALQEEHPDPFFLIQAKEQVAAETQNYKDAHRRLVATGIQGRTLEREEDKATRALTTL